MSKPSSLGQFEQLVVTAILTLGDEPYGVTIHTKVQELGRTKVTPGAIYITLDRLHSKGYISSWLTEPIAERGGRAKRCYRLEPLGEEALRDAALTAKTIWDTVTKRWGKGWASA